MSYNILEQDQKPEKIYNKNTDDKKSTINNLKE